MNEPLNLNAPGISLIQGLRGQIPLYPAVFALQLFTFDPNYFSVFFEGVSQRLCIWTQPKSKNTKECRRGDKEKSVRCVQH